MRAGNIQTVVQGLAGGRSPHPRSFVIRLHGEQTHHGLAMAAEADDGADITAGGGGQPGKLRTIPIEHRDPARFDPDEDLGLGVGDRFGRGEELLVHRLHGGDDRDVRTGETGERIELPRVVHAHLEHTESDGPGHPRQAQRQAPVVVEVAGIGDGGRLGAQHRPQRLLDSGLADAAGDADDPRHASGAGGASEVFERPHGVVDQQQRRVCRNVPGNAGDHRGDGAPGKGVGDERVAVELGSLDRDEQVTGPERPGIDRDTAGGPRRRGAAAGADRCFGGGPQRGAGAHRSIS